MVLHSEPPQLVAHLTAVTVKHFDDNAPRHHPEYQQPGRNRSENGVCSLSLQIEVDRLVLAFLDGRLKRAVGPVGVRLWQHDLGRRHWVALLETGR
jgi:hypothetical protein